MNSSGQSITVVHGDLMHRKVTVSVDSENILGF